ncbi:hypothetical protein BC831DRAFT_504974, partial [Entophlyctis helioformis]
MTASKHVGVFDELAFNHNELLNAVSERLQAATTVHASGNAAFDAIVDCLATLASGRTFEAVEPADADAAVPPCLPIWRTLFEVGKPAPITTVHQAAGHDVNNACANEPALGPAVQAAEATPDAMLKKGGVGIGMDVGADGKMERSVGNGVAAGGLDSDRNDELFVKNAITADAKNGELVDVHQVTMRALDDRMATNVPSVTAAVAAMPAIESGSQTSQSTIKAAKNDAERFWREYLAGVAPAEPLSLGKWDAEDASEDKPLSLECSLPMPQ